MDKPILSLTGAQMDRLEHLSGMIAYLNHATACVLWMQADDNRLPLGREEVDGYMLLADHLAQEMRDTLESVYRPGQPLTPGAKARTQGAEIP